MIVALQLKTYKKRSFFMPVETKIKEQLKEIGMTMVVLCEKTRVKYFTMSCYLNGKLNLPDEIRNRINIILNSVKTEKMVNSIPGETKKKPRLEWQIQNRMKKVGLTLTVLAIEIDVGYSKLCNYISGRAILPDDLRKKIDEVLDRDEKFAEIMRIENEKSEEIERRRRENDDDDDDDRYRDDVDSQESAEENNGESAETEPETQFPEFDPDEVF
jgi:hypothetical protein